MPETHVHKICDAALDQSLKKSGFEKVEFAEWLTCLIFSEHSEKDIKH